MIFTGKMGSDKCLVELIMVRRAGDCQRCYFNSMVIQRLQFVVLLNKCPVKCFLVGVGEGLLVTSGSLS